MAPRGASALGFDLGPELGLARFVRTAMQASPWTAPGGGALRSRWTPSTGAGGQLGVLARDHRDGLAPRTGAGPVHTVQGAGVLGEERPALRPGAGQDGDALRGLALYPQSIARCSSPSGGSNVSTSSSTAAGAGSFAGRTTPARVPGRSQSSTQCSCKPLNVVALLFRPCRMSASAREMRRAGATCFVRRWPPGPPSGSGAVSCVPLWALGCMTSCRGGTSATRRWCCASHFFPRSTSASPTRSARALAFGGPSRGPARP